MVDLSLTRLAGSAQSDHLLVAGPSLGTSATALWTRCAALLDDVEVTGWDLPGHGHSRPATEPFSVSQLADAVQDGSLQIARGRRIWYAGVSLGGAVGLHLALEPSPFIAVALLASAPQIGSPAAWYERAGVVRAASCGAMINGSAQRWFAHGFMERHADVAGALLASLSETDARSYALACEALAAFDIRDRVAAVKVPILLVAGEHDKVVTSDALTRALPGTPVTVLPGCGHLLPAEDPVAVATLLTDFFATKGALDDR